MPAKAKPAVAITDTDVLICGAGPTGLVLALWLTAQGVRVRIVDRAAGPGTTSRALGVQARTLELYRQLDLSDAVVADGYEVPGFAFWSEGRRRVAAPFRRALAGLTAYPYLLIYPQDRHERLLVDRLRALGVEVGWDTEVEGFEQFDDRVVVAVRRAGETTSVTARYITGCDGARSVVRRTLGIGFPGGTYDRFFYVADVEASGSAMNGDVNINLDTAADFLAVFPLDGKNSARLVGTVLADRPDRMDRLTFEDISEAAVARMRIAVDRVNWFSTYRVHHRVADRFRDRRAFLLGDAAHIHSPAGGQGMNTGIGDAVNLAWKIAAVLRAQACDDLLDTYQAERQVFARRLVATTDRVFTLATSSNRFAQLWRTRVAPLVVPLLNRIPAVRRFNFRTVSQIALNYRRSVLSAGRAGRVRGGDRLPWVEVDGADNYASGSDLDWQIHVYGEASRMLSDWAAEHGMRLHAFRWSPAHGRAGLAKNAAYLVRPDRYVALAEPSGTPGAIAAFLRDRGLLPNAD